MQLNFQNNKKKAAEMKKNSNRIPTETNSSRDLSNQFQKRVETGNLNLVELKLN